MLALLSCALAFQSDGLVTRDEYGVPHIKAESADSAWYEAGYETARDRMWQMEQSRRLARGRMSEVFGSKFVASDTEILKTGYTDEELQEQFDALAPKAKVAIEAYAKGVTDFEKAGPLPPGYAEAGFQPEPWTPIDTLAISVRLFQQFGRGGAGEIRNLALLAYLQGQPKTKDRFLDVMDDFAWQNDPAATCTISPADDPLAKEHPVFPAFDHATTMKHLAMVPKLSLLELLPGIRLSSGEDSKLAAEQVSAPFKWGSYAVVVGPTRSLTGCPILLSAPQMGHRQPSILHEMSIDAPGLSIVGVDVPGVPGVIIGKTDKLAWGLTSGVADTDDIFFSHTDGPDGYTYGKEHLKLQAVMRTLKVKGEPDKTITQLRTRFGPVIISNKNWIFSRRSSYWMREMKSYDSIFRLYDANTPEQINAATEESPMSFNFFWATPKHFGYRYAGAMPIRASGLDPRLPTPGEPEYDWKGYIPATQMPHVIDPKSGLLANWNNKPVSWWPNMDTPVWGRIFRNSAVLEALQKPKLNEQDVEMVAWTIAREDYTWPYFKPFLDPVFADPGSALSNTSDGQIRRALITFDGRMLDGSMGAQAYAAFFNALQEEIFMPVTGNFMGLDNYRLVAQPTVMWNALSHKTKVDYLEKRTVKDVIQSAMLKANNVLAKQFGRDLGDWRYTAPSIKWGDEPPVPYSNRGTMIQVIDLGTMSGRNIVPPGIAESGPHADDQVPLARAWLLKPMRNRK
ncbi:MAG TPA: penicillin acylase family protein [Fimbriimonadaceae bacterium]|nr:penicillin acylase family protein [Fimbriimonadaceae bacterium]